jgi:hypothetical protein
MPILHMPGFRTIRCQETTYGIFPALYRAKRARRLAFLGGAEASAIGCTRKLLPFPCLLLQCPVQRAGILALLCLTKEAAILGKHNRRTSLAPLCLIFKVGIDFPNN